MASLNEVRLISNLGNDPDVRDVGGEPNCTVSVATTRFRKGEYVREEVAQRHRVALRGQLAGSVGTYLKIGASAHVGGYLETRKWTDKEGKEQYTTEVIATEMQMLGGREGMGGGGGGTGGDDHGESYGGGGGGGGQRSAPAARPAASKPAASKPATGFDNMDDDIPF